MQDINEERVGSRQSNNERWQKSINNGFSDNVIDNNNNNNEHKTFSNASNFVKEDRYSLRKLAKTLLFNSEQEYETKQTYGYDPLNYSYNYSHSHNYNVCVGGGNEGEKKRNSYNNTNTVNKALQKNEGIMNVSNNGNNSRFKNIEEVNINKPHFKIIAITNIPKKMSISTLLSQLYGGPLRRIELVRKDNYQYYEDDKLYEMNQSINWDEVSIFLHFNEFEDAEKFYIYSKTGLFKVNDIHLKTVWIPEMDESGNDVSNVDNNNECNEDEYEDNESANVSEYSDKYISKLMKGEEKARRVLVFKKPLNDKRRTSKFNNTNNKTVNNNINNNNNNNMNNNNTNSTRKRNGYPDAGINYSEEFKIDEIKEDFGKYGKLVEVLPVVSRKLCFGLQYYDVKSAIKVKRIIQQPQQGGVDISELDARDVPLRHKYEGWYIWYGRDPADKSVPL